ncbi:glycosyltransferase [Desulfonatronovibrio hydrogenovorans]|uniref:glycosyltransferase n=1 Tax=Desulfonatronovibrio hydrogenovorans TaxID=53245 RepID=UPI00054D2EB2|nr:glycosyltransferase [Desulfonatronovibrio hydrogenovorans]
MISKKNIKAVHDAIMNNGSTNRYHCINELLNDALYTMEQSDWAKAVRLWQDLIIELGEKTPKQAYHYLDHSYKELKKFPKGKEEEEITVGDVEKHEFLLHVHENLCPKLYLEIGVQKGKSLKLAKCPAIGIDPMPQIETDIPEHAQVIAMTSDDFFKENPGKHIKQLPDLAFIDGMHLFEFVLRDFINVERLSAKHSVIVVDDIFPGHPAQAERKRRTRNWTGDVWKLYTVLQKFRPELTLIPINVSPTGVLIITNLQPESNILSEKYDDIVKQYSSDIEPPKDIIDRKGCLDPFSKSLNTIFKRIRESREIDINPVSNESCKLGAQNDSFLSGRKGCKNKEKIAIYTAITGCCDNLSDPESIIPGIDYICFTDNPHLRSDVWDIRLLPSNGFDYARKAKLPKILPHRFLPDYQISLWIDGNIRIKDSLLGLIIDTLCKWNIALFRHPENRQSIEQELHSCIKLNKDDPKILNRQIASYKTEGFSNNQAFPACGIILRRHNHPKIMSAMESWWDEIMTHSFRDQLSFPYVAWKHELKYKVIHDNLRDNKYFKWYKHDIKTSKEKIQKEYEQSDVVFLSSPGSGLGELSDMLNSHLCNQHLNLSFSHNYYDLYPDCPGNPEVLYPELLSCKPLVVLHRDPQKSNLSYFKEKSKQKNLYFESFENFSSSEIYGIKRQTDYENILMQFYNNHPGPRLFIKYDEFASSPSEVIQSINNFISNINPTNHIDINLTCQKNDYSQNQTTKSESVPEKMELLVAVENAMNQKAWDRVISLCQDLFDSYKNQVPPEAYVLYSMALRFKGNHAQAHAVIAQGEKKFPEDTKIHAEFAQVAKARGNPKLAETHLNLSKKLTSIKPKKNSIEICDTDNIDNFLYSDPEGVAVIMPCIDTQQGLKTADILQRRAGMPCKIIIANDTLRLGFIKTANEVFKRLKAKYVVYLAQDAFPGRDWLVLAYQTLEKTGKGLLAFNDGKWKGRIASFGMVRVQWVHSLYGGDLFYNEYKSHGADNELTVIARATNEHVYNPHCSLIEVDYDKDRGGSNPKDRKIFENRFISCFDHTVSFKNIEWLASEYNVNMTKNVLSRIGESISDQVGNTKTKLTKALLHINWTNKHKSYSDYFDFIQETKTVTSPKISIIVISWKFHPDTIKNFQILEKQRNQNFELIFVDNGGKPGEFDELKPYIDTYVRLNTNTGAYLARNIGAIFSKAPILFFLDDDGIPAENIVKAHLDAHEKYDVIAVRGVCRPKTSNPLSEIAKHYYLGQYPFPKYCNLEGNVSFLSKPFFKVQGWDDNIQFGHGGIDLSYRLLQTEPDMTKQIYSPDPVIYHDFASNESHLKNKLQKQQKAWQYLIKKHGHDFLTFKKSWKNFEKSQATPRYVSNITTNNNSTTTPNIPSILPNSEINKAISKLYESCKIECAEKYSYETEKISFQAVSESTDGIFRIKIKHDSIDQSISEILPHSIIAKSIVHKRSASPLEAKILSQPELQSTTCPLHPPKLYHTYSKDNLHWLFMEDIKPIKPFDTWNTLNLQLIGKSFGLFNGAFSDREKPARAWHNTAYLNWLTSNNDSQISLLAKTISQAMKTDLFSFDHDATVLEKFNTHLTLWLKWLNEQPLVIGHNDLSLANVFIQKPQERIRVIDWAHCGYSYPGFDPAHLYADAVARNGLELNNQELMQSYQAGLIESGFSKANEMNLLFSLYIVLRMPKSPFFHPNLKKYLESSTCPATPTYGSLTSIKSAISTILKHASALNNAMDNRMIPKNIAPKNNNKSIPRQPIASHASTDSKQLTQKDEYFFLLTQRKKFLTLTDTYQANSKGNSALTHYLAGNAYFHLKQHDMALKTWNVALKEEDPSLAFIKHRADQLTNHPDVVTGENLLYPEEPRVHVLILTMNRKPYLQKTFKCLGNTDYSNYKVFLLDNCSSDGTQEILPNLRVVLPEGISYIHDSLPTNIGRPGGHNWLLTNWDHSEADFIAILDDDLLNFEPNWLKIFLNTFTLRDDLAAVGSKTLTPEGRIQDAFPVFTGLEDGTNVTFFTHRDEVDIGQYDYCNNIPDYVTGCASLFKKEIFNKIGLFDIRYSPSQYVDIDHGIRMRLAGYDLMYNGNVPVIHAQLTHDDRKKCRAARGNQRGNAYKLSQKYSKNEFAKILEKRKVREKTFSYNTRCIN